MPSQSGSSDWSNNRFRTLRLGGNREIIRGIPGGGFRSGHRKTPFLTMPSWDIDCAAQLGIGGMALRDPKRLSAKVSPSFAHTMAVDLASRRVMEKAGLTLVRTFHQDWPDPIGRRAWRGRICAVQVGLGTATTTVVANGRLTSILVKSLPHTAPGGRSQASRRTPIVEIK